MTVEELIRQLEKMPQDYNVVYMTYDEFGDSFMEDVTNVSKLIGSKQIELY